MVSRVFHLVYKEIKGLHQAAYVLGLFAFGSQLLAIVRDRLLAHTFGAGVELDLYYTAFRIPDLLFVLFASMLSVYVLLPFVSRATEPKAKQAVLAQVFTLFLIVYTIVACLLALFAPLYVPVLFPGFAAQAAELTVLLQILLLQPLFLGLSSICGVVTQLHHRFVLYAISPLLYNVGIILGVAALYPFFGLPGLVAGVVIGAIGHVLVQVPFVMRSNLAFSAIWPIDWGFIRELIVTAVPRSLTLSLNQLVLLFFVSVATTFTAGSVAVFQLAYNIQSVPLAIIGMSYSVAAFPTLSHLFAARKHDRFNEQVITAMRHIIFWSVPIVGLVIVLRAHIVRVLLGSGEFDWSDTRLTAAVLAVFAVSLAAQALLLLLVRALYAGGRTTVPLLVTVFSSAVAVVAGLVGLSFWNVSPDFQLFVQQLFRLESLAGVEIIILAAAFGLGQLVQLGLLLVAAKRIFAVNVGAIFGLVWRATLASFAGGAVAYLVLQFVVEGVNQNTLVGIMLQGTTAGIAGVATIWLVYWLFKTPELKEVSQAFRLRLLKTDVTAPQ